MASVELAKSRLGLGPSRPTLYQLDFPTIRVRNPDWDPDGDDPLFIGRQPGVSPAIRDYLQLFIRNVSLPQLSHEVMPTLGHRDMGVMRLHPVGSKFTGNQLSFEVIENSNFSAYRDLRRCYDSVGYNYNPDGSKPQRLRYYDEYTFPVLMRKLEFPDMNSNGFNSRKKDGGMADAGYRQVASWTFDKCYVARMGEISMSSDAFDSMTSYEVVLNYETYYYEDLESGREYTHMDKQRKKK